MKKLFTILSFLFIQSNISKADCVMVPLSLSERVAASSLIVEARVGNKTAFWNTEHSMIYTSNELLISRVYKGAAFISGTSLQVITSGGTIGDKAIRVDPELELETGEIGIFMLVNKEGNWVSESGPQGFIRIDKHDARASDVFHTYPAYSIQKTMVGLTGLQATDINALLTKVVLNTKRATPAVTSISPKTITAGTSSVLTIKGSSFNSAIDTSSVQFRNGDDGGLSFIKALKRDYISWSDTMIRLIVRTKAGTGKIRLVIAGNGTTVSSDTLKISYAHLNVVSGDSIGYETQQIGMNLSNGITWKLNKRFYDSSGARSAFIRSLERWRCGTYINWDTLGRLNHSAIKSDGVNMCAWDSNSNMPSGVLAQCFSYWSGCFTPGLKWYVNELDIRFRIKPTGATNWNYTTGNALSNQFHFESVATHELGHGHQMGHVINSAVVMHYSIANGQTKPGLSANDISAGNYVIAKSGTTVCGRNGHSKLNSGNCAIVAPNPNFSMGKNTICRSENIVFTDSSAGNITAWAWDFGANASPATANTKGPHTVNYSSGGNKTISLTISTITGNLNKTKNLTVQSDSKMLPDFTYIAAEKGKVTFTNTSNNHNSNKWYFGDGDSSTDAAPVHSYSAGGTYNVRLVSTNTCNTDDSIKAIRLAWLNFTADKNTACISQPLIFTDSSDNLVSAWTWTFAGGSPSSAVGKGPHKVIYSTAGNKSATLSVNVSGGGTQTYTRNNLISIGTDTLTSASFIYGYYGKNIVGFENKSSGSNMTYKWYFGDGDSSSEKHPVHTYTNANNQNVRLLVSGSCGSSDTTITLRNFTDLDNPESIVQISLYPNPAGNSVTVFFTGQSELYIQIMDISGKQVSMHKLHSGEHIDLSKLPAATYILKASDEYGNSGFRLLVKY